MDSLLIMDSTMILGGVFLVLAFGFVGVPFWLWSLLFLSMAILVKVPMMVLYGLGAGLFLINIPLFRMWVISVPILKLMTALKFLPTISKTEKEAIEAGTVWMDAELFSGKPNIKKMLSEPYPQLTEKERAFLEGPTEELCRMVDDWTVFQERGFSKEVWSYIKTQKFLGMIIPEEYGGLGFSGLGHSAIIKKLSSRSTPLAITVMVPNSLGPAELLIHYGTKEQKDFYLPRLALGDEIPCFALTEPQAGSDAGAMTSNGVLFKKETGDIWIRLNLKKRYITLASISTVIGLAFKLKDPDNLLGKGTDLGITVALIPSETKGIELGKRHDPLTVPFYNCPIEGTGVEVPLSVIVGGAERVGQGWRMLMECLAAGRGISLPSTSTGGAKMITRVLSAYCGIRRQFGLTLGKFEGIQEPLAKIVGFTYLMEAARCYTAGAIDSGHKPSVVSAIAKYNFTEMFRDLLNHAMDIQGGAAISLGPRNTLGHAYFAAPISITVEGANILTRTLIIFGQGAIRCHPYVLKEIHAIEEGDKNAFDRAFWKHVGHTIRNFFRYILLSLTRGYLASVPFSKTVRCHYRRLSWASAQFAFFADVALISLGGALKRKESLTGRFADVLSWMYLGTAVLRRYEADGRRKEDLPMVHWCMNYAFFQIQQAFEILFPNMGFVYRLAGFWMRLNPIGRYPSDKLGDTIAAMIQKPGAFRDRFTEDVFVSKDPNDAVGRFEQAFEAIYNTIPLQKKLRKAVHQKILVKDRPENMVGLAVEKGILTQAEADQLVAAEELRRDAVQVDEFTEDEYFASS